MSALLPTGRSGLPTPSTCSFARAPVSLQRLSSLHPLQEDVVKRWFNAVEHFLAAERPAYHLEDYRVSWGRGRALSCRRTWSSQRGRRQRLRQSYRSRTFQSEKLWKTSCPSSGASSRKASASHPPESQGPRIPAGVVPHRQERDRIGNVPSDSRVSDLPCRGPRERHGLHEFSSHSLRSICSSTPQRTKETSSFRSFACMFSLSFLQLLKHLQTIA